MKHCGFCKDPIYKFQECKMVLNQRKVKEYYHKGCHTIMNEGEGEGKSSGDFTTKSCHEGLDSIVASARSSPGPGRGSRLPLM